MILTGHAIWQAVQSEEIAITPFDEKMLNSNSIDLTLGEEVKVYRRWARESSPKSPDGAHLMPVEVAVDTKQEASTIDFRIGPAGWYLRPGIGYLMHTQERVFSNRYVPVLDGKSSLGRLFIQVHTTAGFGDIGFDGQYTLEVTVTHPVIVHAGMRIAQMRFHSVQGEISAYAGNYQLAHARGAVASRAFKQFEEKKP